MSGLAASLMFTPYRATKRRVAAVVSEPALADANLPASAVSACLGYRYCGRTARRADTFGSTRKGGEVYRRAARVQPFQLPTSLVLLPLQGPRRGPFVALGEG